MTHIFRVAVAFGLLAFVVFAGGAQAQDYVELTDYDRFVTDEGLLTTEQGVAIGGYDPVAYFTEGKAVKGAAEHSLDWQGARWHFAAAANRDAFEASPEKYAPQYGGWCAFGVSEGYGADIDPVDAWTVHQGKLYLNFDVATKERWREDLEERLAASESKWPSVKEDLIAGRTPTYFHPR